MYRRKLKQKLWFLVGLTALLLLLIAGRTGKLTKEQQGEEGERLEIPKGEGQTEAEQWTSPGANPMIRVLLLGAQGSIYHKEKIPEGEYAGTLQYYEEKDGWVIVNEVPLEEYLRWVVPSEMPSRYAAEALKAQAICARTYAVWQMQEYAYPEFESHVDDSVAFQVYHAVEPQESTDQAVRETAGQIMLYQEQPVKAYYFSTSCGATTDENIWEKGDRERTPYIAGRLVNTKNTEKDLTSEKAFSKFIRKKHADDLEISEPWYRWNCYVPLSQIQENAEEQLGFEEKVTQVEVTERNTGGAVQKLLLKGEQASETIVYEYPIRQLLSIPGGTIHKNDGTEAEGSSLLPSGYFILEPVQEKGKTVGYEVYGGGLGHGAGMSQNGARILAEQGGTCDTILHYFYKDVELAILE